MVDNPLSEISGRILMSVWKLNGIGSRAVQEQTLRLDLKLESDQFLYETEMLTQRGFLDRSIIEGQPAFSLTPLGLAILRQLEEDRLQELR
jgi:hypothetical protein